LELAKIFKPAQFWKTRKPRGAEKNSAFSLWERKHCKQCAKFYCASIFLKKHSFTLCGILQSKSINLSEKDPMAPPVFLRVSAGDCTSCKAFASYWPLVKKRIQGLSLVRVIEVDLARMQTPVPSTPPVSFPAYLDAYVHSYYPCFLMINGDTYAKAEANRNTAIPPSEVRVFNGEWIVDPTNKFGGYIRKIPNPPQHTTDNLANWVLAVAPTLQTSAAPGAPPNAAMAVNTPEGKLFDTCAYKFKPRSFE
jgi:hypothetical protein